MCEYYCEKCGNSWFVHNDDGSCIDDQEKQNAVFLPRLKRVAKLDKEFRGYYDHALPQPWAEKVLAETGVWPCGHLVWLYDNLSAACGRPYPVDEVGDKLVKEWPDLMWPSTPQNTT